MMKSLEKSVPMQVAHVYDILDCGPRNRFVANGKLVHNSGGDTTNPQNLPRGGALRESIEAPEGHMIVACDSSQIEARTLAWFAGQEDLLDDFRRNADVYSIFASKVFGHEVNKHDHPKERFVGKTCFAEGTRVLTEKGWKPIEKVRTWDRVWDGWVTWEQIALDEELADKAHNCARDLSPNPCTDMKFRRPKVKAGFTRVYDIANAGPRHRFVVRTDKGPLITHNCVLGLGYSVGANKLRLTLKNGGVDLPLEECERIVGIYRTTFPKIPQLWKECGKAIEAMKSGYSYDVGVGLSLPVSSYVNMDTSGIYGQICLPNEMKLRYPDIKGELNEKGWTEYTYRKKRFRSRLYGGALTENIIQALARIVVSYQMLEINNLLKKRSEKMKDGKLRKVVHMVHDEVIVIVPEDEAENTEKMMRVIMSKPPEWAKTLPVSCDAGKGKNYGEAK